MRLGFSPRWSQWFGPPVFRVLVFQKSPSNLRPVDGGFEGFPFRPPPPSPPTFQSVRAFFTSVFGRHWGFSRGCWGPPLLRRQPRALCFPFFRNFIGWPAPSGVRRSVIFFLSRDAGSRSKVGMPLRSVEKNDFPFRFFGPKMIFRSLLRLVVL